VRLKVKTTLRTPKEWRSSDEHIGPGLCWVLGLLTPFASILIACTMSFAITMVHLKNGDPFVTTQPGGHSFEPALGYLAIAVAILLVGPGKLALDALIFGHRKLTDRVRQ
jgi:putative oxidoreductase